MSMPPTPLQINYIDPDGNNWDLSDLSMAKGYVCTGINGIEGLTTALQTIPLLDGTATPNLIIPQPGTIGLGLLVGRPSDDSENGYYVNLDMVARAFYNRRKSQPVPGYIVIQRPDGSTRQIAVFTTSGLPNPDVGINNMSHFAFTLQTPDPYWQDSIPNQLQFSMNVAAGILPLLPVALAGNVIGNVDIYNNGNAQTWPVWTITGPGIPTIKNLTSNRQWSLNTTIPSGNVVQIVTKPGQQMAVNLTTGANIWDQLVLGGLLSNLWSLMAGLNSVNIAMSGSTSSTSIAVSWTNRWNRALWLYCL
jgi:hypothetical protein